MNKKMKNGLCAALLAVLMICCLVFAGCGASVVSLEDAVKNACKEKDQLSTLLSSASEKFSGGACTASLRGEVEGVSLEAVCAADEEQEQSQLQLKASYNGADLDGTLTYSKGELRLTSPAFLGTGMVKCDLTQEITGYLATIDGVDANTFRELYESASDKSAVEETSEKVKTLAEEQYKSLEFDKIDPKEIEIDGKTQKCAGRGTSVTGETLADWAAAYEEVYADYLGSLKIPGEDLSLQEEFDQLDATLRKVETVDLEYYVYKDRLAELLVHAPNLFQADLILSGGATPTENLQISVEEAGDGEKHTLRREGKTEEGTEVCSYYVDEKLVLHREYRPESGELVLSGEDTEFSGTITGEGNALTLAVSGVKVSGQDLGIQGEITLTPEAVIEIPEPEGSVYNLNTMTEQEFYPLIMQLYSSKAFQQIGP